MIIWFVGADKVDPVAFFDQFEKALAYYNILIENGCSKVSISSKYVKKLVLGGKYYLPRLMNHRKK